jgi:ethanolamine utilization cobalamin adenosyltransferase
MGNDSVVVLTLKQGRAINNLIDSLEKVSMFKSDSILTFKKYIDKFNDSIKVINKELISQKLNFYVTKEAIIDQNRMNLDSLTDYKNRYYKNIEIYNKYEKSTDFEIKLHRLNSVLFAFLAFFMYSQIK